MVEKYHAEGSDVLIIGHHNHPEVEGTAGRVPERVTVVATEEEASSVQVTDPARVGYVTQTTLTREDIKGIVEILRQRFPLIRGPRSNICFATQNRQDAVKILAQHCDIIFVVGSKNSSNSNRLKEVAGRCKVPAYLVDDQHDIQRSWLGGVSTIGITAGASAPERLVDGVIGWLKTFSDIDVQEIEGNKEDIHFPTAPLPGRGGL